MASMKSSPIHPRPIASSSSNAILDVRTESAFGGGGGGGGSGGGNRKRRQAIDPPEDLVDDEARRPYRDSEIVDIKRRRRNDDLDDDILPMGWLSLRPPDPPANYHPSSCAGKRKVDDVDDDDDEGDVRPAGCRAGSRPRTVDRAPPATTPAADGGAGADGRDGGGGVDGSASHDGDDDDDDMAIDDDDREDSDGDCDGGSVVSESSIRNAMYQLVFGRWSPPSPLGSTVGGVGGGGGGGGGVVGAVSAVGRYDVVDSKIEDLIRRSRLEAVFGSSGGEVVRGGRDGRSEGLYAAMAASSSSDVDMDDDVTEGDVYDGRSPGRKG